MRDGKYFLIIVLALGMILLMSIFPSYAAAKQVFQKKTAARSMMTLHAEKSDLIIKSMKWSQSIRQGDTVGRSSILNMVVANQGKSRSNRCEVQVECVSLSGGSVPSSVRGTINLMPLNPGQSMTLAWPPMSSQVWPVGKFKIAARADFKSMVPESNENNNIEYLIFTVDAKIKIKTHAKPVMKKAKPLIEKTKLDPGNLTLIDFDILSVQSTPLHPYTEADTDLIVRIKNKTNKRTRLSYWIKCKPLDGGAWPRGGQPGQEIVENRKTGLFDINETRDVIFCSGEFQEGRYRISAAKDKEFKNSLVSTLIKVKKPENAPAQITSLEVCWREIELSGELVNITTQPDPMRFRIEGGGFDQQSTVYYKNTSTGGNIWPVDDLNIKDSLVITGFLPVSASNTAGTYLLWAKNSRGEETARYRFKLVEPGSPPQINHWEPKIITSWGRYYDTTYGRWGTHVTFRGSNLSKQFSDHWIESNTVSDHLKASVNKGLGFYKIFFTTRADYRPQDGEIKVWIYNKHRDSSIDTKHNAQWFNIKVRNEPVLIDPPAVLAPEQDQEIALKDIEIKLKDPSGIRVSIYELEWKKKAGMFFFPVSIADTIDKSFQDHIATDIIPISAFEHEGVYMFRARVKESNREVVKPDPQWSEWRKFKVLKKIMIEK